MQPYNPRNLWHNLILIGAIVAIAVGLWALTMLAAMVIWVVLVAIVAIALYFVSERIIEWGTGR